MTDMSKRPSVQLRHMLDDEDGPVNQIYGVFVRNRKEARDIYSEAFGAALITHLLMTSLKKFDTTR